MASNRLLSSGDPCTFGYRRACVLLRADALSGFFPRSRAVGEALDALVALALRVDFHDPYGDFVVPHEADSLGFEASCREGGLTTFQKARRARTRCALGDVANRGPVFIGVDERAGQCSARAMGRSHWKRDHVRGAAEVDRVAT